MLRAVATLAIAIVCLSSCGPTDASQRCSKSGFEYACHEPSFSKHFGWDIELPADRKLFEDGLTIRGIYFVESEDYDSKDLQRLGLDTEAIKFSIVVIDRRGGNSGRGEKFRAYINEQDKVVLISNEFGYLPF